jgi:HAMP domain-containing protein
MAGMNRRQFAISALSASLVLIGCDTDQKPSHTATLLNNGEVQEALKSLADAIDNLSGDVSNFDTENWREVVPEVKSGTEEVSGAFERLRRALQVPS